MNGCQRSNQKGFLHCCFWCSRPLVCLMTIGMGCEFWREEVVAFGIHAYKCGFREEFAFVCSFVRISKSETCVR